MNVFPKWLIAIVIIVVAAMAMWYFYLIILCILLAGILSLINKPVYDFLRKIKVKNFGLPPAVAALLTIVGGIVFFSGLFAMIIPLVTQQARMIAEIDVSRVMNDLRGPVFRLEELLHKFGIMGNSNQSLPVYIQEKVTELINVIHFPSIIQSVFETTGNIFLVIFSTFFILFFFLKEENLFLRLVSIFLPEGQEKKVQKTFDNVRRMLFRYFLGIMLQVSIIIVYVSVILHLLGVENSLLIGVLAGLLNVIPYVGPLMGAIVGITLGIVTHLHTGQYEEMLPLVLKIMAVFASMQLLDNNVLQPFIFSKSANAHPLEIFIVIVAAGTVFGIWGMVIAVPAYTTIKIILFEFFGETAFVKRVRNTKTG